MTISSGASLTRYLSKLRAATTTWSSQVVFFLVLVAVFFVIDQLVVSLNRNLFHFSGSRLGWWVIFLIGGDWIPGVANAIVVAVATRARTILPYVFSAAALSIILSIAYYNMAGLDYSHDPMLGSAGIVYLWVFANISGGLFGLVIKLIIVIRGK